MIKFASLFTACLLTFAVNSYTQNKNEVFTILSYNVENLFDTINDPTRNDNDFTPLGSKNWNSPKYFNKLDSIAKVIK